MKKVTDTSTAKSPFNIENMVTAQRMGYDGILAQEAAGSAELVDADELPRQMSDECKAALIQAGVVFPDKECEDKLFVYAILPKDWKKKVPNKEDPRGIALQDQHGRMRAGIFYKAAFYDRKASMYICRRYTIACDYDRMDKMKQIVVQVKDHNGSVLFETAAKEKGEKYWEDQEALEKVAKAWVDEHYPDWQNPSAYWETVP